MNYDYIYNSEKQTCEAEVRLDENIEYPVHILFEKEGVVLRADRHGNADFFDMDENMIYQGKAEADGFFSNVRILVKEEKISARFLVTKWIDHYPNCDGEHDRWSERIVDEVYIYCTIK